jgi:hypothetical protein
MVESSYRQLAIFFQVFHSITTTVKFINSFKNSCKLLLYFFFSFILLPRRSFDSMKSEKVFPHFFSFSFFLLFSISCALRANIINQQYIHLTKNVVVIHTCRKFKCWRHLCLVKRNEVRANIKWCVS